ncbi:MAG TPA: reverse transcriptase family protein [Tepidisphaeraceae bacterium]|jgi:hypothetical protein|nr:reverse transcriptase family protein [Tepidisphaeraceae bacterium]
MAENEKARLYQRIVSSTPDFIVLSRMQVHGFWPTGQSLPPDPVAEVAERDQLDRQLVDLRKQASVVKDPDKVLAQERQRRGDESKKRRAEKKAARLADAQRCREAWGAKRAASITHLGDGVSASLQDTASDVGRLTENALPVLNDGTDVARLLNIPIGALRWLTFHRRGATLVHYHRYDLAKRTGGVRSISAPKPALAMAQQCVLSAILSKVPVSAAAHGFVPQRSIVSNAAPHAGKAVVANMDLRDFFPSITFRRVKGMFRKLGYSEQVATVLALLCTEPPRVAAAIDGKRYYVALGDRVLPQGGCTSPAITNVLCRKFDRRLEGLAGRYGFTYTRYADDLTFSSTDPDADVGRLLRFARAVITAEGFTEHPTKTKVMRASARQEVTGITVNARPKLSRADLRQLRSLLHNAAKTGLDAQNRTGHADFAAYVRGRVGFACMVDPSRAEQWQAALAAAMARAG